MVELNFVLRQPNVSNLIGKGGATVKNLEKETNTKINLQKDSGMLERDFTKLRNVHIRGEKEDLVKGVVKIVSGALTPDHDSPFLQLLLLPGGETEDSLRKGLMGHSGLMTELVKVNRKTSARVKVVNLGPAGIFGIEILSTTEEEMEEAVEIVMDLYQTEGVIEDTLKDGHNRQEILDLLKGSIDEQLEAITSKETIAFLIPEEKTSFLIGPKGAVVKKLEEEHSVRIIIEKPDSPYFFSGRVVLVKGEVQNIAECFAAGMEEIFKNDSIDPRVVCLLPAGVPKYLIGYSGETIKRLQEETGCKLKVERADVQQDVSLSSDENESQYCQISGTRDNLVRGIRAVIVRILFQLILQGQTSEGTVPQYCVFGKGKFGKSRVQRAHQRFSASRQKNIVVTQQIRESYPTRSQSAGSMAFEAPIKRRRMFDDLPQTRHLAVSGSTQLRYDFASDHGYSRGRREHLDSRQRRNEVAPDHGYSIIRQQFNPRGLQEAWTAAPRDTVSITTASRGYGTARVVTRQPAALRIQNRRY